MFFWKPKSGQRELATSATRSDFWCSISSPPIKVKMAAGKAHIGKLAPDFKATAVMPDGQFKDIKLSDYRGKYVVFFFYPLDFTFVCPTEIIAFSDAAEEFRKINCEVIGASVDSHFCHHAWIKTPRKQGGLGHMKIPLVSDTIRTISKDYGVLKEDEGIAYRGLFIIDDKGILRQITINDLPVGRSIDETLRLVQAFQFTDKHGEVCPAGWKPGSDTIKPDVQKSKDFFSKQFTSFVEEDRARGSRARDFGE
ncbi:peroxiredoxin-1-like [Arapaima gigas]